MYPESHRGKHSARGIAAVFLTAAFVVGMTAGPAEARYGGVKPHVAKVCHKIDKKFHVPSVIGVYGGSVAGSDHPKGRACDFMIGKKKMKGWKIARNLRGHWGRYDVKYVIYRQKIRFHKGGGWQWMEDRGSRTANHMDHVHVSFTRH